MSLQPTIVNLGESIIVQAGNEELKNALIIDVAGHVIQSLQITGTTRRDTKALQPGMYFIKLPGKQPIQPLKFIVQ